MDETTELAVPIYYSEDYVAAQYAFDTTRKAATIAYALRKTPVAGVELLEPAPLTADEVREVHDPAYVSAVETGEPRDLAESQGFKWEAGVWKMVLASNGGVVEAARAALSRGVAGSLSSGMHHARRDRGSGFCTFNGLVLAANAVLREGAESVLILDLDAHCGGGTHSLVADDARIWHVDVSVDDFDAYSPSPRNTIEIVEDADSYLAAIERQLDSLAADAPKFSLCLYNAGMDPHECSATGGLAGINTKTLAERERMVFEWCRGRGIPVAFVLAGGYSGPELTDQQLGDLHTLTAVAAVSCWHG